MCHSPAALFLFTEVKMQSYLYLRGWTDGCLLLIKLLSFGEQPTGKLRRTAWDFN